MKRFGSKVPAFLEQNAGKKTQNSDINKILILEQNNDSLNNSGLVSGLKAHSKPNIFW